MWVLRLNDMRSPRVEYMTEVCRASDRASLEKLLELEMVEPYNDGQWGKRYRQGGPLEWFNPPMFPNEENIIEVGSRQQVIDRAIEKANNWYSDLEQRIPTLESLNAKST